MQNMRLKSTLIVTGLIVLATPILSCAQQIDLPQGIAFFAEHEGGLHVLLRWSHIVGQFGSAAKVYSDA